MGHYDEVREYDRKYGRDPETKFELHDQVVPPAPPVEPKLELWEFYVPTVRNDGRPFRTRYHRVWDQWVRDLTGGLTIYQPAKGQWVDPRDDQLYEERMIPVRIACTRDQVDRIIEHTKVYYDQIAVMAVKISEEVLIK